MLNNNTVKHNAADDPLSIIFAALADPTRRAILDMLSKGPATVNELGAPFAMSLPAISRHLKVLERAGLISRGKQAQWRPCTIEPQALEQVSNWANRYKALWSNGLDNLDAYLQHMQKSNAERRQK